MGLAIRIILAVLGGAAVLICLSIMVLGAGPAALSSEHIFDALSGYRGPDSPSWPPSMDSELRFYAPFWGAYGLLLLKTSRDARGWAGRLPVLAAVFFAGGVGRALSWVTLGPPHPVFIVLMAIELMLPPLLMLMWLATRRPDR